MSDNRSYKACLEVMMNSYLNTKDLLLEIAKIAPATVVKAAKKLQNKTDLSIGVGVKKSRVMEVIGPHDTGEVSRMLGRGEKITAIKLIREKTGLGLKEAKDIVDAW